jgi:hypothetical protein
MLRHRRVIMDERSKLLYYYEKDEHQSSSWIIKFDGTPCCMVRMETQFWATAEIAGNSDILSVTDVETPEETQRN